MPTPLTNAEEVATAEDATVTPVSDLLASVEQLVNFTIPIEDLPTAGSGAATLTHIGNKYTPFLAWITGLQAAIHALSLQIQALLPAGQTLDHLTMTLSSSSVMETATPPTLTLGQYQTGDSSTPYTDTLSPANAFSSSMPSVATIGATSGLITLQGPGSTTFTRTAGGKSVTASLTVTAEVLTSTPSSLSGTVGGTSSALVIKDQFGTDVTSGCTFASDNTGVATVDSSGVVTYVSAGTCNITATHTVDGETCTVGVTVSAATAPTIGPDDIVIINSDSAFAAATQKSDLVQESGDTFTGQFWPYGYHSDGGWQFETNLDGAGKNALRWDFPEWTHTTLTAPITGSPSAQTFAVASTAGMTSSSNILNINPRGTGSESIASWTVVDATHINGIVLNNHASGELVGVSYESGPVLTKDFTASATSQGAYYRMRMHAGKTATAGGVGVVPAFAGDDSNETYFNPGDLGYSGCKRFLLERTGRLYLIFVLDSGGTTGHLELHSDGINMARGINVSGATFNPDSVWGTDVEFLVYMKPGSSGDGSTGTGQSTDGIVKVWINGVLLMDYSNLPIGTGPITALQMPATFRSAKYAFSEYYTHVSAWIPVPATSAVPGNPIVGSATTPTQTTLTYPITAQATGEDPYTVFAEVDENGTGSWVAQPSVYWTTGLGGTQNIDVTGLTAAKNYTGKIRFTFHDSTGNSAAVDVTDGTTVDPTANGSPTMSNASAATPNGLTFAGTLNASGTVPTALRYQYSTASDMSGAVQGPDFILTAPSLGGAVSAYVAVPNPSTQYYVQFAEWDGTTQSGWGSTVSGTTTASANVARSTVYARPSGDLSHRPLIPNASQSATLPLATNANGGMKGHLIAAHGSSGSNPYVQATGGAATQSVQVGRFATPGMNAGTVPAGNYSFLHAMVAEGPSASYELAGVLYVYRPSTDTKIGTIYDSATGISTAISVSGNYTTAGRLTTVNLAAGIANNDGDVIVWEPYYVGTGSDYLHFCYDGTDTITQLSPATGNYTKTGIAFPSAITFQE